MQALTGSKVAVLLMLGAVKLVFGLSPLVIARSFGSKRNTDGLKNVVGVVLCIGGGVLFSTVFIHMLVEVRESMERAKELGMLPMESEYPLAELMICLGFLFILLVESVVHKWCGGQGHGHGEAFSADTPQQFLLKIPEIPGSRSPYHNPAFIDETSQDERASREKPIPGLSSHITNKMFQTIGNKYSKASNSYNLATDSLAIQKTPSKAKQTRHSRELLISVREVMVVMALSVHSLFEGLAVGLEDSCGGVWQLFLAIAIHSIAIVFCIGTDMVNNGTNQARIILSMVVLSLVSPIGVVVGIIFTHDAHVQTGGDMLLMGVLQGLACGSLLYITFFEVLNREKLSRHGMSGMVGALFILLGFSLMAALNILAGHSHGVAGHAHGHGLAGHSHGVTGHTHGHGPAGHGHVHEHEYQMVKGDSFGERALKSDDNHGHGRHHHRYLIANNEDDPVPHDGPFLHGQRFKINNGEEGNPAPQQQHNSGESLEERPTPVSVSDIGNDSPNVRFNPVDQHEVTGYDNRHSQHNEDHDHHGPVEYYEGSDHDEEEKYQEEHDLQNHNEHVHYQNHRGKPDHLFDYSTI